MVDSLSRSNSINYCGYIHHRYIVWTDIETNTLYFLPKYPFLEIWPKKKSIGTITIYGWKKQPNHLKYLSIEIGVNFHIINDYKNLVMMAINKSTQFHFSSEI